MAEEHEGQTAPPDWVEELRQQNEQLRGEVRTLRDHATQQGQFLQGLSQGIAAQSRGQGAGQGQAVDWDKRFYEAPTETFHHLAGQYKEEMARALREQEERLTQRSRAEEANRTWWQVFFTEHPHLRSMERVCVAVAKEIEPELIRLNGDEGRKALLRALGPAAQPPTAQTPGTTRTLSTDRRGVARPGGVQARPARPTEEDEDEDWGGTLQVLRDRRERREQARKYGPTRHVALVEPPERGRPRRTG